MWIPSERPAAICQAQAAGLNRTPDIFEVIVQPDPEKTGPAALPPCLAARAVRTHATASSDRPVLPRRAALPPPLRCQGGSTALIVAAGGRQVDATSGVGAVPPPLLRGLLVELRATDRRLDEDAEPIAGFDAGSVQFGVSQGRTLLQCMCARIGSAAQRFFFGLPIFGLEFIDVSGNNAGGPRWKFDGNCLFLIIFQRRSSWSTVPMSTRRIRSGAPRHH